MRCLRRNYQKAASAVKAMRAAAVLHSRGASFNKMLQNLQAQFQSSAQHQKFWQLLVEQRVTLISDDEASGAGVSAAEAENFLKQHITAAKASFSQYLSWPMIVSSQCCRLQMLTSETYMQVEEEAAQMAVDAEAEDEFADME